MNKHIGSSFDSFLDEQGIRKEVRKHAAERVRAPVHPGEILRNKLDAIGISASDCARQIGVPITLIHNLTGGRRKIDPNMALRLELWLGTSALFWLNLQLRYDLHLARKALSGRIEPISLYKRPKEQQSTLSALAGREKK